MHCEIIDAANLSSEHQERWSTFQRKVPTLDAPSYYPEFVRKLATHIPHCKVAVLRDQTDVYGYVGFSEIPGTRIVRSIPMCDYDPIIIEPGRKVDARNLVQTMGYRSWRFDAVGTEQLSLSSVTRISRSLSPRVVLSNDHNTYRSSLIARDRSINKFDKGIRLLERDCGRVAVTHDVVNEAALERLLQLKAEQLSSKGFPPFVYAILSDFLGDKSGRLSGQLSVLSAGDKEIALAFCLKAGRLLYYWFPAYNRAFQKYSPGLLLLWLLIRDLASLGCDKIDFGPGGEPYKDYFANAHLGVYSGIVHANPMAAATSRAYDCLKTTVRSNIVVQNYIKPIVGKIRKTRQCL